MKIDINKVRTTPKGMDFNLCVFGKPSEEIKEWCDYWGFELVESGRFTNIIIPDKFDLSLCFNEEEKFQYVDGFSPNLNKYLHIGHFSNLVIAKSFQSLGIGNNYVAILGDTLDGDVNHDDALEKYQMYCGKFGYKIDEILKASTMKYLGDKLKDGEGDYSGTKIFDIEGQKIVGIKSGGDTTYFYQDVSLAEYLSSSTLYMTGKEQEGHFVLLKKMYPHIKHIGLGLLTVNGKKMSSREGNVIYVKDMLKILGNKFSGNDKLSYNVFAGQVLKSSPNSNKDINTKTIDDVKLSMGLYLSYTAARLKSAGINFSELKKFHLKELQFKYIRSKCNLSPNILFESLVELCKKINTLYEKHTIKGNDEVKSMFSVLLDDLEFGMKKLGLFSINKV